jgi:hypothetical protein
MDQAAERNRASSAGYSEGAAYRNSTSTRNAELDASTRLASGLERTTPVDRYGTLAPIVAVHWHMTGPETGRSFERVTAD